AFLTVYGTGVGPIIPGDIESRLLTARISIIVLPVAVVTVRHENDPLRPVFDIDEVVRRWDDNSDLLRKGSPALLHELLDVVVDEQFDTIRRSDTTKRDDLYDDLYDNVIRAGKWTELLRDMFTTVFDSLSRSLLTL
ncbi:MAG: magnesium transporter, partial [Mycobacterium sp.]